MAAVPLRSELTSPIARLARLGNRVPDIVTPYDGHALGALALVGHALLTGDGSALVLAFNLEADAIRAMAQEP
jgi:hypothetical protein